MVMDLVATIKVSPKIRLRSWDGGNGRVTVRCGSWK